MMTEEIDEQATLTRREDKDNTNSKESTKD